MAQQSPVYDPKSDEQGIPRDASGLPGKPGGGYDSQKTPLGDSSDPRSSYNPQTSPMGDGSDPRSSLSGAENSGLYNPAGKSGSLGGLENVSSGIGAGIGQSGMGGLKGARSRLSDFFAKPGNKKKTVIGGGLTAGIITGVVGISSFVSGPMQLVHLSEILQNNFSGQEDATKSRTGKLLKYWRSGGDVGHTRLGMLGSKHFKKTMAQLSDMGIEFKGNGASHLKTAQYDTNKLQKKYPELKGMSQEQQKKFLSKKLGLPLDKIERVGGKFAVNMRDMDIKSMRLLGQNSFAMLEDGKVSTGLKFRVFSQYFDIPSMWHPLKRAEAKAGNKLSTAADRKKVAEERKKAEEERQKKIKPAVSPEAETAKSTLKKNMAGLSVKSFGASLMVAGTVCLIRDSANAAILVNRAEIVLPAAAQATDKIAIGAQIKSGQDIDAGTVGEVVKSFKDKETGKTIWQGKALQATANPSNAAGEDLDAKYGQAFSSDTKAHNIRDAINERGGKELCSPAGKLLQLVGGLALLVAAIPSGGSSIAAFAGAQTAQTAAFMGIMVLFQQAFNALINDGALLPAVMSGAQGGNLIAYGAREFSNMGARADGGVQLSKEESLAIDLEASHKSKEEFQQKNFLAKVFDPYDYRTPAGQFASSTSPDIGTNVATLGQSMLNFGSILPKSFASLLPSVAAADEKYYDWPFPRYGIPKEVLNDSVFDDPYDNGDKVASLLDSDDGQNYVDKAAKCFGVNITKDGEEWTVSGEGDVDPNSDEYNDANCDDLSDTNWKRIMLFVFDTRTMLSIACYDGNNEACTELGVGSGAPQDDGGSEAASVNINMADLKKSSVNVECASGSKDLGVQDGYTEGNMVKIRICAIEGFPSTGEESNGGYGVSGANGNVVVNSRVSAAVVALVKAAKEDNIPMSANSSFRTMLHQQALCPCDGVTVAVPGTSNHQLGVAIDFAMANQSKYALSTANCVTVGGRCAAPGDKIWEWLDKNAQKFDFKPYDREFWHWSPLGS